jgi:hypothetical protein
MAAGQSAIAIPAALVWAMVLEVRHPRASGVLLGLSTALKLTIGLPFVAYAVVRRRWLVVVTAGLVAGGIALLAVARMELAAVPGLTSWSATLADSFAPGGANSLTLDSSRASLVNLQNPLTVIFGDQGRANVATFIVVVVAALVTLVVVRVDSRPGLLLGMSLVACLTLLFTYHRYYDAVLLALPVAWGTWATWSGRRGVAITILLLCSLFLLPLQTAAFQIGERLPAWLTGNLLWQAGVMAAHAWTLVAIVLALIVGAVTSQRHDTSEITVTLATSAT